MPALSSKPATTSLRLSDDDQKLIEALRRKIGISASSEILRMGLHELATKHGLKA